MVAGTRVKSVSATIADTHSSNENKRFFLLIIMLVNNFGGLYVNSVSRNSNISMQRYYYILDYIKRRKNGAFIIHDKTKSPSVS